MGVSNLKKFNESAQKHNVTDYQLIMGADKSGRNVKGMLIGGYMFDRLSLYGLSGTDDIDELMQNIACYGVAEAYKMHVSGRNSKATQKASDAHGRFEGERLVNYLQQVMTYADPFENIQFKGQTWISVLNQLVERETACDLTEIETWKNSMRDWHANSEKVCNDMLLSGKIRVLDGHIIPEKYFKNFLSKYCEVNGFKTLQDSQMLELINKYCERYMKVVEGV